MVSRLKQYIPSYGTKQTKTYKTPTIKPSKKTSSLKKLQKKFYTTKQNDSEPSFWHNVKNWWYGKKDETNLKSFEKNNQYKNEKNKKLYEKHLELVDQFINKLQGSMSRYRDINGSQIRKTHKIIFDEMIKVIDNGGVSYFRTVPVVDIALAKLDARAKNINFEANATKLYEFAPHMVGATEALITIDRVFRPTAPLENISINHSTRKINDFDESSIIKSYIFK